MFKSQNGWPAHNDRDVVNVATVSVAVKNGTVKVPLRREVAPQLTAMIQWWDANIEPVYTSGKNAGTWGWAYRMIRGSATTLSNHASGTAIDVNAPLHPLGKSGTVPADKVAAIKAKAAELGLRWGGEWTRRPDEMHFEVVSGPPPQSVSYSEEKAAGKPLAPELVAYAKGGAREIATRGAGAKLSVGRRAGRNWWVFALLAAGAAGWWYFWQRSSAPMLTNGRRRRR